MAAPLYQTDLSNFDLAENLAAWIEFTNMSGGGAPDEADNVNKIQGDYFTTQTTNVAATTIVSMGKDNGSPVTLPTDGVFLIWHQHTSPGAIGTYAQGGMRAVVGSAAGVWKAWAVGGSDVPPNPYGGWQNIPIDPTYGGGSGEYTNGSPATPMNYQVVGGAAYMVATVAKGQPHQIDAIRYGRAEARFLSGESGSPGTFAGFAATNDTSTNRWGLIQATAGGYLWKGLMTIGFGGSPAYVSDSNTMVLIQDCKKVGANFNKIEVRNSGTTLNWTNISFQSLCSVSKGRFEAVDNATINFDGCTFTDMDSFIFQSNSSIASATFRRCGQVTQGGATFDSCLFAGCTATVALVADSISGVTNCDFISSGTGHAIQGFSVAGSYDLTTLTFSGYATSNGSSGNETIYVTCVSGEVDLSVSGGTPSIRTAGATVNIISDQITLTFSPIVTGSDIVLYEAGTTTVLTSSQNIAGTSSQYIYDAADSGSLIDIGIFKIGYTPFYIRNYELGDANATVPIAQVVDRFYLT